MAAADIGNIRNTKVEESVMKLIMIIWIVIVLAVLYFLINDFKEKILNRENEDSTRD